MNPLAGGRSPVEGGLERRLAGALLLVLAVWIVLLSRLFYLQLVEGDQYRISAQRQSVRTHRVEATRGIVFDRHGVILVDSRPSFDVLVVPHETRDVRETVSRVAGLAELDAAALDETLRGLRGSARFQPVRIGHDLPREALARVEARLWALDGVLTQVAPVRAYPFGDFAAHVLGALGEISAAQLEQRAYAGYRRGDVIGQRGIEGLLDRELRGRAGGRNLLVDAHGKELELLSEVDPQPGHNVRLTLDHRMQLAAERALDETGRSGAAVALDVRSGEVLVLANRPAFDPNHFALGIDRATWNGLLEQPEKPLQNRALQGQYPPGSTFKVITAIAGLEEKAITPHSVVHCAGSYRLGRRRYRCWKRGGHGYVSLQRALVESCDVYFYQTAQQVGVDRLAYYARALGLGSASGIELRPEAAGLVPTSAWKLQRFGEEWIEGETLSVGIGQGFNLLTPMQLARAYAAIANGGRLVQPYLTSQIEDPQGSLLVEHESLPAAPLPISEKTLELVRAGLRGVVQDEHGTGYLMRKLPGGIEAAGKTGTAQVVALAEDPPEDDESIPIAQRDHAWFVTYVPAQNAEIAVAVLVEHGGHGGSAAAPVARRIVEAYLERRGEQLAHR